MLALTGPIVDANDTVFIAGKGLVLNGSGTVVGTGGTLWDASYILCQFLERCPNIVQGKKVLELGSGLGLGAIGAKVLGASEVIASDVAQVVSTTRNNLETNQIEGTVIELDWETPFYIQADVILMADLVWIEPLILPLVQTLKTLVTAENKGILVNKRRSNIIHRKFLETAQNSSLKVELITTIQDFEILEITLAE